MLKQTCISYNSCFLLTKDKYSGALNTQIIQKTISKHHPESATECRTHEYRAIYTVEYTSL